jgi:hypothetical protein
VRPPGIRPLEIWNRLERVGDPAQVLRVVETLHREIRFDAVFVGGGGVTPAHAQALASFPVRVCPDGAWVGERGGLDLLCGEGAVVDVGQTSIKVSWRGGRRRFERDWARLPFGPGLAADRVPEQRARLREFIASALPPAGRIVLALPAELDDRGVPGPCSYLGMDGDMELVRTDAEVLLLNDAELAAVSARPESRGRTLVLTIGFGLGGAVIE